MRAAGGPPGTASVSISGLMPAESTPGSLTMGTLTEPNPLCKKNNRGSELFKKICTKMIQKTPKKFRTSAEIALKIVAKERIDFANAKRFGVTCNGSLLVDRKNS